MYVLYGVVLYGIVLYCRLIPLDTPSSVSALPAPSEQDIEFILKELRLSLNFDIQVWYSMV